MSEGRILLIESRMPIRLKLTPNDLTPMKVAAMNSSTRVVIALRKRSSNCANFSLFEIDGEVGRIGKRNSLLDGFQNMRVRFLTLVRQQGIDARTKT
jgi:hypothetical protein